MPSSLRLALLAAICLTISGCQNQVVTYENQDQEQEQEPIPGAEDELGYASVFPCEEGYRGSSTLNYSSASPVSNAVVVDASRGGVCARVSTPAHLIFDAFGVQH